MNVKSLVVTTELKKQLINVARTLISAGSLIGVESQIIVIGIASSFEMFRDIAFWNLCRQDSVHRTFRFRT